MSQNMSRRYVCYKSFPLLQLLQMTFLQLFYTLSSNPPVKIPLPLYPHFSLIPLTFLVSSSLSEERHTRSDTHSPVICQYCQLGLKETSLTFLPIACRCFFVTNPTTLEQASVSPLISRRAERFAESHQKERNDWNLWKNAVTLAGKI